MRASAMRSVRRSLIDSGDSVAFAVVALRVNLAVFGLPEPLEAGIGVLAAAEGE